MNRVKLLFAGMFQAHLRWMTTHPYWAILIALVITAASVYAGTKLSIKSNLEDLFPDHTENVVRARAARAALPMSSQIVLGVSSSDKEANIRFMTDLHDKLIQDEQIDSIEFRRDISFFRKNALLFLDEKELEELDLELKEAVQKAVSDEFSLDEDEGEDTAPGEADEKGKANDGKDDLDFGFDSPKDSDSPLNASGGTKGGPVDGLSNPKGVPSDSGPKDNMKARGKDEDDLSFGFDDPPGNQKKPVAEAGGEVPGGSDKGKNAAEEKAEKGADDLDFGFDDPPQKAEATAGGAVSAEPGTKHRADGSGRDASDRSKGKSDKKKGKKLEVPTEQEIKERYGVSNLSEYMASADGLVMSMKIFPTFSPGDVDKAKKLLSRLEETITELNPASYAPDMAWEMEGDYHSKIAEIGVITSDLTLATIVSLILVTLIVMLYFWNIRSIIVVMVPILAGMAWTMGLASVTIGYLNLITAFIFAILFGLGVDYAIHVTNRYQEERALGKSPEEASMTAFMNLGRPMFGAALTTTVAFLCLVIFDFRGFSQFGFLAGMGVPVSLACVYMFFPGLAVGLNRLVKEKPPTLKAWSWGRPWLFGSRKGALVCLAIIGVSVIGFLPGLYHLRFEHNMKRVMTDLSKVNKDKVSPGVMKAYRKKVESRSASPIVMLTGSREETQKVHNHLQQLVAEDKLLPPDQRKYSYLQEFSSIFDTVPQNQEAKKVIIDRMKKRLVRKLGALEGEDKENAIKALEFMDPQPYQVEELPDWVRKKFTDSNGGLGHFVLLFASGNKADAEIVGTIIDQLGKFTVDGKDYHTTASYFILSDAYNIVLKEGPIAMALAALLVLLIVLLDFRTLRETVAGFVPLMVGVFCYLGFVGWDNFNINMFNMIILPTIFGMGIDTSIHIMHRTRQEGMSAMSLIASTTGAAGLMSAATTALGFGTLVLATNPGLESIGWLAPVGIMLCYLTSMLMTCAILTLWKPGSKATSGKDPVMSEQ